MKDSDEQKNPFMFEEMYPGKDIGDYNSEEAYEMGVSAGMDSQQAHYQTQAAGDELLDTVFSKLNGSGAHACYCPRSTDGGCTCALKDEYLIEVTERPHPNE